MYDALDENIENSNSDNDKDFNKVNF